MPIQLTSPPCWRSVIAECMLAIFDRIFVCVRIGMPVLTQPSRHRLAISDRRFLFHSTVISMRFTKTAAGTQCCLSKTRLLPKSCSSSISDKKALINDHDRFIRSILCILPKLLPRDRIQRIMRKLSNERCFFNNSCASLIQSRLASSSAPGSAGGVYPRSVADLLASDRKNAYQPREYVLYAKESMQSKLRNPRRKRHENQSRLASSTGGCAAFNSKWNRVGTCSGGVENTPTSQSAV